MEIVLEVAIDVKCDLFLSIFYCDEFECGVIGTVFNLYIVARFSIFLYLDIGRDFNQATFSLFIVFFILDSLDCSFRCDKKGIIDVDMDNSLLFFFTCFIF